MAGAQVHQYPPDDNLVALVREHGSVVAVARQLGLNPPTLDAHIRKQGLRERCAEARRGHQAAKRTAKAPTEKVSREEILEQELAEARAALKHARADDVREERVIQTLAALLPAKAPRYRPGPAPKSTRKDAHTLVLLWSDTHAGEVVSAEETNGANEYNWEIMLRRHDELRRGVLSFAERFGPVEELVILGLGDMLSGNIHQELAETNEMPFAESAVQFGLDGAEFVESFVEHFPKIRFAGVVGNHPRLTQKPRAKTRYDNGDWIAYQVMAQRLSRHPKLDFHVPKPQAYPVLVYDRRILCVHGDGIRSSMVGVPWGGVIRHTARLGNQYAHMRQPIDHYALGHYHEANAVKNRRILMNGSVKGIDEYALQAFGEGEPATQLLLPFHRRWGLVGAQYIDLQATG